MDKNIIAFLREDTYTVKVKFEGAKGSYAGKSYTYVSSLPRSDIAVGAYVVVPVKNFASDAEDGSVIYKLARVTEVHDDVKLEPNYEWAARWIVAVVDFSRYIADLEYNANMQEDLNRQYRLKMRQQLRDQLLLK
jgi:hypothetical protein